MIYWTIYIGYMVCKKCGAHMDWGTERECPNCGCHEGEQDS